MISRNAHLRWLCTRYAVGTLAIFAHETGTSSLRLSQRRPLALCEVSVAGSHLITVDAFDCDPLAAPTFDGVIDPRHDRSFRRESCH